MLRPQRRRNRAQAKIVATTIFASFRVLSDDAARRCDEIAHNARGAHVDQAGQDEIMVDDVLADRRACGFTSFETISIVTDSSLTKSTTGAPAGAFARTDTYRGLRRRSFSASYSSTSMSPEACSVADAATTATIVSITSELRALPPGRR
jgi:hypothetical protein